MDGNLATMFQVEAKKFYDDNYPGAVLAREWAKKINANIWNLAFNKLPALKSKGRKKKKVPAHDVKTFLSIDDDCVTKSSFSWRRKKNISGFSDGKTLWSHIKSLISKWIFCFPAFKNSKLFFFAVQNLCIRLQRCNVAEKPQKKICLHKNSLKKLFQYEILTSIRYPWQ